eukprot:scaffold30932_cov23-Cyclotella_meneghiniana.AAC.4
MTGPRYLNKQRDYDDDSVNPTPSFIANQLGIHPRQLDFNSGSISSGYSAYKPEALHFDSENNSTNTEIAMNNSQGDSESEGSTPDSRSRSIRLREDGDGLSSGGCSNPSQESGRELERLRREHQEMIDRQQALVNARAGGNSRGRALGRMPMYEGQDQVNYSQVNRLAREMFVQVKHLAPDWNVESTDSSSMYQRIIGCGGVTIPEGWDKYVYFKKYLGRYFVGKYRTMRTNFITYCREAYLADTREGRVELPGVISDLIAGTRRLLSPRCLGLLTRTRMRAGMCGRESPRCFTTSS